MPKIHSFFKKNLFTYFTRRKTERARASTHVYWSGRGRESSKQTLQSTEANAGLNLTTHESMTKNQTPN